MLGCVHHWRQEVGNLKAPFRCLRCGAVRQFETNFFELMDKREAEYSLKRGNGQEQQPPATTAVAHGEGIPAVEDNRFDRIPKVLVVDDEVVTTLMVKQLLEGQLSCDVETALTGRQALEKAEKFHPDLALLDIRMPDMDGFEVCQRIKDNPLTAPSAIVYFSAYPKPAGGLENAEAYISKPFEPSTLVNTVRKLVSSGASGAPGEGATSSAIDAGRRSDYGMLV